MKKYIILIVLFGMAVLIACTGNEPTSEKKKVPKISKKEVAAEAKSKEEQPVGSSVPPEQLAKAKKIIASVSAKDIAAVDAQKKYKMVCGICHGFKGDLNVNGAKDLTESTLPLEESVAQVYYGKGLMTPFKGLLSDTEIVAVCKYIEKLR